MDHQAKPKETHMGSVALVDRCAWQSALTGMTGCQMVVTSWSKAARTPVAGGDVGGKFIVAAAEVLDERVTGTQDPGGPVALESAHRPEPGLQPAMVGFDRIIRILLDGVQR
jgi:hypothetical protein